MTLADFSRAKLCVDLRGRDVVAVLSELSLVLERNGAVPDALAVFNAAVNRHFISDGDTLAGVAYPNSPLPSISRVVFAVGRAAAPFTWRMGLAPVNLVCLIAAPTAGPQPALLAALGRLAGDEHACAAIQQAANGAAILATLQQFEVDGLEPGASAVPANVVPKGMADPADYSNPAAV